MIYMMVSYMDPFAQLSREFDKFFGAPLQKTNYPPYNVKKVNDDHFVMEFAVAGFTKKELDVSVEKDILTVKGEKLGNEDEYLYKGIATRKFIRSFQLPEYFEISSASAADGILYIDLHRNMPEAYKKWHVEIK
jgi:molecular chaperone IbpA